MNMNIILFLCYSYIIVYRIWKSNFQQQSKFHESCPSLIHRDPVTKIHQESANRPLLGRCDV